MVRVAAALAWHDESPEFLDRCVRSLGGVCDELVALDGAWQLFPGGSPASPREQEDAIWEAARDTGLTVRVRTPLEVFESQVEKRQVLMAMAGDEADWVLVIDADEYIAQADGDSVHAALEVASESVGIVTHRNLHQGWTAENPDPPRAGMNRRLYRSGTTVITVHSGYVRDGEYLHVADPVDLREALTIEHDNWNRGDSRNERSREYRRARERERVEVWL